MTKSGSRKLVDGFLPTNAAHVPVLCRGMDADKPGVIPTNRFRMRLMAGLDGLRAKRPERVIFELAAGNPSSVLRLGADYEGSSYSL